MPLAIHWLVLCIPSLALLGPRVASADEWASEVPIQTETPIQPSVVDSAELDVEVVPPLRPYQAHLLRKWFEKVGQRRAGETFGDLLVRAGRWQIGQRYGGVRKNPDAEETEQLRVDLSRFECVSLVESTIAVARCVWQGQPNEQCFAREVVASRYRDGEPVGYASRLHYFSDWIEDNDKRDRIERLTEMLGGEPMIQPFNYMSQHPREYDGLADATELAQILDVEARLSSQQHYVLDKRTVAKIQDQLQNGDLVAIVSNKHPGLMIGHVGFVDRVMAGKPRYLHASSYHQRVVLTRTDIAHYVTSQTHRLGILVLRPVPPKTPYKLAQLR
ncbi:MAG: hypothetical protein A2289_04840 [Deltaproteobacteria bacterium RIFOXYA12_FULL_58_15]|nr:MAG: hypothetical protein A2289_04840 [Deltaproteobacteria bacterium RIFOXYA12_FULL_58_15]OGR14010.1 MAG: hypothetical protein A2341_18730 [Deltaproteobacteria bacterium RIFOXYB12_FULL_58_9]